VILRDRRTGEVTFDGLRASRAVPCWVCADLHKRQSWCLVDPQRGKCICPRVESSKRIGNAGWLHEREQTGDVRPVPRIRRPPIADQAIDWQVEWQAAVAAERLQSLAGWLSESLALPEAAVGSVAIGNRSGDAAFLMTDADGNATGLKLRTRSGKKLCALHSRLGVIRAKAFDPALPALVVTEGESDLMVAAAWGMNAVARVGCRSCEAIIARMAQGKRTLLIADNDQAGIEGAKALAMSCRQANSIAIVTPPANIKDLRAWAQRGATRSDVVWRVKASASTCVRWGGG